MSKREARWNDFDTDCAVGGNIVENAAYAVDSQRGRRIAVRKIKRLRAPVGLTGCKSKCVLRLSSDASSPARIGGQSVVPDTPLTDAFIGFMMVTDKQIMKLNGALGEILRGKGNAKWPATLNDGPIRGSTDENVGRGCRGLRMPWRHATQKTERR